MNIKPLLLITMVFLSGCIFTAEKFEPIFITEPPQDLEEKYDQVLTNFEESDQLIKEALKSELKLDKLQILNKAAESLTISELTPAKSHVKTAITNFDNALVKNKQGLILLRQIKSTSHSSINQSIINTIHQDRLLTELLNKQALICNIAYLKLLDQYSIAKYEEANTTIDELSSCSDKRRFVEEYILRQSWKDENQKDASIPLNEILKNV